jgi:hypothetical protein
LVQPVFGDLEKNSIFCWFDLKNAFEKHFRGTYKRPATTSDLQACIQKKGETSRNFLTRWLATRNECENVDNRTAMHAFIGGLQMGRLLHHKLTCFVNESKLTLMSEFGNIRKIRRLIRSQVIAGAQSVFALVLEKHPTIDLMAVVNAEGDVNHIFDTAFIPSCIVVDKLEHNSKVDEKIAEEAS